MSYYIPLSEQEFDNEENERRALINLLTSWYPYPSRVWSRKSTSQLWAIYYKGKPKPKPVVEEDPYYLTPEEEKEIHEQEEYDKEHPMYKTVDGVNYIRNDGGGYSEIYD